jgi:prepilin-type N-terminal cleavage/methylation domain-containing protein
MRIRHLGNSGRSRPCGCGWTGLTRGFTFLEVLIALAILTILAAQLLSAEMTILRADQLTRALETQAFQTQTAITSYYLGQPATTTPGVNGWDVRMESVSPTTGTSDAGWLKLTIAPSNRPSAGRAVYLRAGRRS